MKMRNGLLVVDWENLFNHQNLYSMTGTTLRKMHRVILGMDRCFGVSFPRGCRLLVARRDYLPMETVKAMQKRGFLVRLTDQTCPDASDSLIKEEICRFLHDDPPPTELKIGDVVLMSADKGFGDILDALNDTGFTTWTIHPGRNLRRPPKSPAVHPLSMTDIESVTQDFLPRPKLIKV